MKKFIKKTLSESLVYELIDLLDEDYPSSFDMEEFKTLNSFAARIRYCEEHLQRISSGSSRIVYKIDDTKVLKLAKNKKGLVQNEIEVSYSNDNMVDDIVAEVFDYHQDDLWIKMELARKMTVSDFKRITGFAWKDYVAGVTNHGNKVNHRVNRRTMPIDDELYQDMWEDEFIYDIFSFIGNFDVPVGDLTRKNSYGIVKRGGGDAVVLIDYGLTNDVYDSYYS
jgi:hypothetical protein